MHRTWILALLIALFAFPHDARSEPSRDIAPDGFEAERAALVKELISGLETYVEWCSTKKVWIERNRALEAILAVDPGNMSAKRGLGWQQVADGVWEPPKEPKPAKNFDPGAAKEAPARFADAIRPWRDHLVRLVEQHRDEVTGLQRDSVYAEILAVDPTDAFVRDARGETPGGKGWVLTETVRAKERRAQIKAIVKQALASTVAVADISPSLDDMTFKLEWKVLLGTDRVRVLSTGDRAEALLAIQMLHATRDVFNNVFGTSGNLSRGFTVYLLCDPASKQKFIDNVPSVSAAQRSIFGQMEGSGLIGSYSAGWWSNTTAQRLDGITRHAFGVYFQSEFNLSIDIAWAWEGLGLYLTREMIGTRLTWYTAPVEENGTAATRVLGALRKKLLTPGTNWMNEGYALVRKGDATGLSTTLGRTINRLTPQDVFVSYVVAAYLLEGEALRLPALLHLIGGGKTQAPLEAPQAWQQGLAMDLETFNARLTRWLGERR